MSVRVSLIVVAEPDDFRTRQSDFFASVAAQTWPQEALELIMVDAHGRSSTVAGFEAFRLQHPAIRASLLRCASTARAVCSNLAAAHASGDLLVFLADDFDPVATLVEAHAAFHALNPDIDAVGIGPALFPEELRQDLFARWQEDSGGIFGVPMRRITTGWPAGYFFGANTSIWKAKFDALGGFDEHFPYDAWDDYEFGLRWVASGGYSRFVAGAVAIHRHAVSFEERCVAMERAGESACLLERLHPGLEHDWRAILRRGTQRRHPQPEPGAPAQRWIAFWSEQLDAAFRRGYFAKAADSAASADRGEPGRDAPAPSQAR